MGARLLPQSYQYPNLSEGADRVGGPLRGDKECPFSGVTKSGRVWRKVPESDARSVPPTRKTKDAVDRRQNNRMLRQCPLGIAQQLYYTQLLSQRLCGTVTKTLSAPPPFDGDNVDDDRFYIALVSALQQTHWARM